METKKYLISTDKVETETLKKFLEGHGDTLSGFLNRYIRNYTDQLLQGYSWPDNVDEMCLREVRELAERMIIEKLRVISRKNKRKRAA
jgi:hypothetical protein